METIIIEIIVMMTIFFVGFFIGMIAVLKSVSNDEESNETEYCFDCENEMPVKEKHGFFYCGNCGLRH